jgi:hypothetical protein
MPTWYPPIIGTIQAANFGSLIPTESRKVVFDFNGIASGDFERIILGNITARAHFLVLLTPSALERCDDPADWLRREIETALANQAQYRAADARGVRLCNT